MWRVLWLCLLVSPAFALQNQLAGHPSPYLAMHGSDPVAWQDWGEEALAKAREQDKLLFISSGYFSCHWCHVMQRESYQNPQIAALLNEHFIPVKLDRELHPALDQYLIDYLEKTQGQAGWPLNIFLTPEGYPLIGATYLPVDRFTTLLERLNATWENKRSQTRNLARRALLQLTANRLAPEIDALGKEALRDAFLRQAMAVADPMEGGFGNQNKFPMTPQLMTLLALRGDQPQPPLDLLIQTTLDQMALQGLRDHLGGGFFRYAVDPSWQVPHFEKMLYTQAQLARVYLQAGVMYGRADYLGIARETLDFALREMAGPHGLLIASFSAVDEQGEEGGPYLWQQEELIKLLGKEDAQLAMQHWAMAGPPTVEGGHLPRQGLLASEIVQAQGGDEAAIRERLGEIRERLIDARAKRDLPADTKELAGWNGLMIGSLALAGQQLNAPEYLEAAKRLVAKLRQQLWHNGELWRARSGGRSIGATSLADYAYLAEGLDLLVKASPDAELAAWRDQLLQKAWQVYFGPAGWHAGAGVSIPGMGEEPAQSDGALRSASALILQLSLGSQHQGLKNRALEALPMTRPPVQEEPFWYPGHLRVLFDQAS